MKRINFDELVKSQIAPVIVIPVKTGIQENQSRYGGSDGLGDFSEIINFRHFKL